MLEVEQLNENGATRQNQMSSQNQLTTILYTLDMERYQNF